MLSTYTGETADALVSFKSEVWKLFLVPACQENEKVRKGDARAKKKEKQYADTAGLELKHADGTLLPIL